MLARGAVAYGFHGNVWTHPRIAKVIRQTLGVKYHPNHVPRLLKKINWTRQKPCRRASQRNEEAIHHWVQRRMAEALQEGSQERTNGGVHG